MAFPNLLNQEEVIQLANEVAPDISLTLETNQYKRELVDNRSLPTFEQSESIEVNPTLQWNLREGKAQSRSIQHGNVRYPYGHNYFPHPYYCRCGTYWYFR